jgi:phosphomevalonate kinase
MVISATTSSASKNKFVHLALQSVLALASEMKGAAHVKNKLASGIDVTILGDNDFYSQRAQVLSLTSTKLFTQMIHRNSSPPWDFPVLWPLLKKYRLLFRPAYQSRKFTRLVWALLQL